MPATPVSICSNALLLLGDETISDFDEGTDRARLASNLWDYCRDYVLRSHPWNCATKRVLLAPDVTAPAFGFSQQFTLPADFLRVQAVGEAGERITYKVEGRKLLMNGTTLKLVYTWRNDVPSTWDALLINAMTQVMKAVFAYPVAQSGGLEQAIEAVLSPLLRQARAVDGQEDPNDALDDAPLYDARFLGGGSDASYPYRGGY